MKKVGNFEAKKTGVVNTVVEDTPSDDASATSSVTISGSEHDRYQRFLGVCGEDPVELFNIGKEEEFDEDDSGFAFDFYNVGNVSIANVEDEWTSTICMGVAKVGGFTFAESEWKKQGRKGRPTKNKAKPDGRHAMESTEGTALVNGKGRKRNLCWWKCYLDSCASYHTLFSEDFLTDIEDINATMTGRCNAGTTVTNMKGTYGNFQVWLNKKGIADIISIPMLEVSGYIVLAYTHADWVVNTPEGKGITFNCDNEVCTVIPYINLREQKEGLVMIETVRKNMGGFTLQSR